MGLKVRIYHGCCGRESDWLGRSSWEQWTLLLVELIDVHIDTVRDDLLVYFNFCSERYRYPSLHGGKW